MRISELTYDDEPIEPEYCALCGHEPLDELEESGSCAMNTWWIKCSHCENESESASPANEAVLVWNDEQVGNW